ncbi:MAG: chromate efflux transporter, partial [Betaproteobacteria bacterium]
RWISEKRFLHALNYCMVLPGPEAQQLATYIGWLMHGTWGGIAAGALFVLPSLAILITLSWIYLAFGTLPLIAGIFYGIKPAVTAIVLAAAWRIGGKALTNMWLWAIAAAAFVAIFMGGVPFPAIVLCAALIGAIGGRIAPAKFLPGGGHGSTNNGANTAIIGDDGPIAPHAVFRLPRMLLHLSVGLGLWFAAMALLAAHSGLQGTLAQMGWFFTKAALFTFGGAYAVLPYVYQGAVENFQWLNAQQMIDGLALGETTPGPLIMVVAFVGFVGGWTKAVLGPEAPFLGAALAASIVTFFTFLPSFLFILIGGPLVEATHGQQKFTAPLTAITAAVVGVIISLALFFAWKIWWPLATVDAPFRGTFEWFSMVVTLAAAVALMRYKANVIAVIVVCGALGVAKTLWGG